MRVSLGTSMSVCAGLCFWACVRVYVCMCLRVHVHIVFHPQSGISEDLNSKRKILQNKTEE